MEFSASADEGESDFLALPQKQLLPEQLSQLSDVMPKSPPSSDSYQQPQTPYVQSLSPNSVIEGLVDMQNLTFSHFRHDFNVDRLGDLSAQHGFFQNAGHFNLQSFLTLYSKHGSRIISFADSFGELIDFQPTTDGYFKEAGFLKAKYIYYPPLYPSLQQGPSPLNTSKGAISGRTYFRNTQIFSNYLVGCLETAHDYPGFFEVKHGDGSVKIYKSFFKQKLDDYHLTQERKANGRMIDYEYQGDSVRKSLKKAFLKTRAGKDIGWLSQEYDAKNNAYHFQGSNGHLASYYVEWTKGSPILKKITSNQGLNVNFEHYPLTSSPSLNEKSSLLIRPAAINYPDGRFYHFQYQDEQISQFCVPDNDGSPIALYKFGLKQANSNEKFYLTHRTWALDPYGEIKRFAYSQNRLKKIELKAQSMTEGTVPDGGTLLRTHFFFWGDAKNSDERLTATAVGKNDCSISSMWHARYDEGNKGNIIEERIAGNLSGRNPSFLKVDLDPNSKHHLFVKKPTWEQTETFTKYYTYSTDGFNLKLTEREDGGPLITYSYIEGTDLLAKKITSINNKVYYREFYSYDDDCNVICHISDDGNSLDEQDLTGVTQRLINRTSYYDDIEKDGCGLPSEKSESYLDIASGEEVLLKKEEYSYETCDRLKEKKVYDSDDALRYTIEYTYDSQGNLIEETDPLGNHYVYQYDANKNCTRSEKTGAPFHTEYTYNYRNCLVRVDEVQQDGTIFTQRFTYDLKNRKTSTTDSYGQKTSYTYDAHGRLIKEELAPTQSASGESLNGVRTFAYDYLDRVSEETDEMGKTTKFAYNDYNQPYSITYKDGSQESFIYELDGRLKKHTKKNGSYILYFYDELKRPIRQENYSKGNQLLSSQKQEWGSFQQTAVIDAMGFKTSYQYDGAGRKILEEKEVEGKIEKFSYHYDSLGRLRETRSYLAGDNYLSTIEEKDLLGRVIEKRLEENREGDIRLLSKETYAYDILGNVSEKATYIDEQQKAITYFAYNSLSQPILITDALGNQTHITYKYDYKNKLGQNVLKVTTTDAMGNQTVSINNSRGQIALMQKLNLYGTKTLKQELFYDLKGQLVSTLHHVLHQGEELRTFTVEQKYDAMGRLIEIVEEPEGENKRTSYTYNLMGELLTLQKPDGIVLTHTYDELGRLIQLKSSDQKTSEKAIDYSYSYDLNHRLTKWKDQQKGHEVSRSYDAKGRLLVEKIDCQQTSYLYDLMGRRIRCTLPDSSSIDYEYRGADLFAISRKDEKETQLYEHRYPEIDFSGRILKSELPKNLGQTQCSYDLLGRQLTIDSPFFSFKVPEKEGYDAASNLCHTTTQDAVGFFATHYSYDDLYQLTAEEGHVSHSYRYDSLNNRLQKDSSQYSISNLNQVKGDGEAEYFYDRAGNLIEKRVDSRIITYTYDALSRLISAAEEGKWKIACSYDFSGRRLQKKVFAWQNNAWVESDNQSFLYQGNKEIGSLTAEGKIKELRLLGKGLGAELGAAVALELNGRLLIPIHDQRGNVTALLDGQDGALLESYRYTSFGEAQIFDAQGQEILESAIENPWNFASKRKDKETGFVYFSQRYYDPALGSWVTPDPAGFSDGPNLYAYVHNNPLSLIDPFGLSSKEICGPPTRDEMERQQPSFFCELSFRDSYDGDYDRGCSNSASNSGSSSRHEEGARSVRETESRFTSESRHTDYRSSFRDEMRLAEEERESGWKRIGDVAFGVAETVAVSAAVASGPLGGAIAGAYLGGKACYELYGVYSTTNSASDYGKVVASNAVSAACIFAPGSYLKSIGSSIGRGAAKVVDKIPSAVKSVVSSIGSSICSMGARAKSWVGSFFPSAAKSSVSLSRGAESINAGVALNRKLSHLEGVQKTAASTRILLDGRVRYYSPEKLSKTIGPTKGACNVTEWNPQTGKLRGWYECHDHSGSVNRVHPKSIDGQSIQSLHYPPIGSEL